MNSTLSDQEIVDVINNLDDEVKMGLFRFLRNLAQKHFVNDGAELEYFAKELFEELEIKGHPYR